MRSAKRTVLGTVGSRSHLDGLRTDRRVVRMPIRSFRHAVVDVTAVASRLVVTHGVCLIARPVARWVRTQLVRAPRDSTPRPQSVAHLA
jgi:hypothetical protein